MIPNCKLFDKAFGNVLQALKLSSLNHSQLEGGGERERKNNCDELFVAFHVHFHLIFQVERYPSLTTLISGHMKREKFSRKTFHKSI